MLHLDNDFMDSEKAEQLLSIAISKTINGASLLKSFYNFDFSTPEGVVSFISLLPLMDEEVLKQASAELWPGSVDDSWDIKRARFEIRGYLMDTLSEGLLANEDAETEAAAAATEEVAQADEKQASESEEPNDGQQPGDEMDGGETEEGDAPPEDNGEEQQ